MKKNLLLLLSVAFIFAACKKEEPLGTVKLDPASTTVKYDDKVQIKPVFSVEGQAKDKSYNWKSSADSIVSVKASMTGGLGELTINRIGKATILYVSSDEKLSASSEITVEPRSIMLNGNFYKKDASKSDVKNQLPPAFQLEKDEGNFLVYKGFAPINNLIYEFKNDKLESLWVVLEKTGENIVSAQQYIEERYVPTGKTQAQITYFINTGVDGYPIRTAFGIFLDKEIDGIEYPLGVRIVDFSVIP